MLSLKLGKQGFVDPCLRGFFVESRLQRKQLLLCELGARVSLCAYLLSKLQGLGELADAGTNNSCIHDGRMCLALL
jgi:hypothetical protein